MHDGELTVSGELKAGKLKEKSLTEKSYVFSLIAGVLIGGVISAVLSRVTSEREMLMDVITSVGLHEIFLLVILSVAVISTLISFYKGMRKKK